MHTNIDIRSHIQVVFCMREITFDLIYFLYILYNGVHPLMLNIVRPITARFVIRFQQKKNKKLKPCSKAGSAAVLFPVTHFSAKEISKNSGDNYKRCKVLLVQSMTRERYSRSTRTDFTN